MKRVPLCQQSPYSRDENSMEEERKTEKDNCVQWQPQHTLQNRSYILSMSDSDMLHGAGIQHDWQGAWNRKQVAVLGDTLISNECKFLGWSLVNV
jgi:hypothetical protein